MFKFLQAVLSQPDNELQKIKDAYEGKLLVETLKTKINRHRVFWVGRSKHDNKQIRLGVEYANGRKYFFDLDNFMSDARISSYEIMFDEQADQREKEIREKSKK
jgi:hypothetical protein